MVSDDLFTSRAPETASSPGSGPSRPIDAPTDPVGRRHPETARATGRRMFPRLGTIRCRVAEVVADRGGATDDEVERALGLSHQSASAAMSTLRRDGWLVEARDATGAAIVRDTRYGNPATVWRLVPAGYVALGLPAP